MPDLRITHVEVYLFRRRARQVQFLALRRSAGRRQLPGVWQPVTGKIDRGERALAAAAREVFEETGLEPRRWWGLEALTVYFDSRAESIVALPLYAAEVAWTARVRLSREHDAHRYVSAAEARRRFVWVTQAQGVDAVCREILPGGRRARELELTEGVAAAASPRRRTSPRARRRTRKPRRPT